MGILNLVNIGWAVPEKFARVEADSISRNLRGPERSPEDGDSFTVSSIDL